MMLETVLYTICLNIHEFKANSKVIHKEFRFAFAFIPYL